jgi:hypothetical protein
MTPTPSRAIADDIERRIFLLCGHKIVLSNDLANLYEVEAQRTRPSRKAQHRPIPTRLHVPAQRQRVLSFEITICDFKLGGLRDHHWHYVKEPQPGD